jgi:tetratricopeptide (TPR) repeat protein
MLHRVLVNTAVKEALLRLPLADRRRVREKFEFLEAGLWDGGLRVKKLRDHRRVVLEARIDHGRRLLFTLGTAVEEGGAPVRLVHVWALLDHDSVEPTVRRSSAPLDAPFVAFRAVFEEAAGSDAGTDLSALAASVFTEEGLEARASRDQGIQQWYELAEPEWQRLLLYSRDELEFQLRLGAEQRAVLASGPPFLLSGTAGSGKTTILLYSLLSPRALGGSRAFVTHGPALLRAAERILRGLTAEQPEAERLREVSWFTFRDLCRRFTTSERFAPEREVDLPRFESGFLGAMRGASLDAALIWEEIRAIIKGAKPQIATRDLDEVSRWLRGRAGTASAVARLKPLLTRLADLAVGERVDHLARRRLRLSLSALLPALGDVATESPEALATFVEELSALLAERTDRLAGPLLALEDYELLGRKRAPLFAHDRRALHDLARRYQEWLDREGRWDEIDLARSALSACRRGEGPRFEFLACDEVQDLTDLQLALLFATVRDPMNLALAGDPKQIISPTGFRWEEVKDRYFERGLSVPPVRALSVNYRSVGSVVALANALLQVKRAAVGVWADERPEDWRFAGRAPILLHGLSEAQMLAGLRAFGAGRTILTRDAVDRDRLRAALGTELVFSVAEAKGLEFRTVLVWRFGGRRETDRLWTQLGQADYTAAHEATIRHEINLLYVAITRARQNLVLYDGASRSPIWQHPELAPHLVATDDGTRLDAVWHEASTPEDWGHQGEYLRDQGHFAAAAECFGNADRPDDRDRALAEHLARQGEALAAAGLLERVGEPARAARLYQAGGDHAAAARCYAAAGEGDAARAAMLRRLEAEGEWAAAAEGWVELGAPEAAREAFDRAGLPLRAAEAALAVGDFEGAARRFLAGGDPGRAAPLFARIGARPEAAEAHAAAGQWAEALAHWRAARRPDRVPAALEGLGRFVELGRLHEKAKDWPAALRAFLRASDAERRALALELEVPPRPALSPSARAIRLELAGRHGEAVDQWQRCRNPALASGVLERAGAVAEAAEAALRAGDVNRGLQLVDAALDRDPSQLPQLLGRLRALPHRARPEARSLVRQAEALSREGRAHPAALRLAAAGQRRRAAGLLARAGHERSAVPLWLEEGAFEEALPALSRHLDLVPGALEAIGRARMQPDRFQRSGDEWSRWRALGRIEARLRRLVVEPSGSPAARIEAAAYALEHGDEDDVTWGAEVLAAARRYEPHLTVIERSLIMVREDSGPARSLQAWARRTLGAAQERGDVEGEALRHLLLGDPEAALRRLEGVAVDEATWPLLAHTPRFAEAAAHLLDHGDERRFQLLLTRQTGWEAGARLLAARGRVAEGVELITNHAGPLTAARFLADQGDHLGAGRILERVGKLAEAIEAYRLAGHSTRADLLADRLAALQRGRSRRRAPGAPRPAAPPLRSLPVDGSDPLATRLQDTLDRLAAQGIAPGSCTTYGGAIRQFLLETPDLRDQGVVRRLGAYLDRVARKVPPVTVSTRKVAATALGHLLTCLEAAGELTTADAATARELLARLRRTALPTPP